MYVLCFDHISVGVSVVSEVSEVSECRVSESLTLLTHRLTLPTRLLCQDSLTLA